MGPALVVVRRRRRAYAEHRPDYAADAVAWCLAGAERPVLDVLDLGAGTGALTAGLVASGLSVTAVEPDPEMLAELRRRLPDVRAVVGRAEAVPLPDDSVDAVLVGTASTGSTPTGAPRDRAGAAPRWRARAALQPGRRLGAVGGRARRAQQDQRLHPAR